jgi:hypothetical protein
MLPEFSSTVGFMVRKYLDHTNFKIATDFYYIKFGSGSTGPSIQITGSGSTTPGETPKSDRIYLTITRF